jgi:hypothetical protein
MRNVIAIATVVFAAGVLAGVSDAAVRKVSFTTTVSAGDQVSLTVMVSPKARCTIKVVHDTTVSHAKGLGAKTGTGIAWSWKVGSSTHAGSWPVTVDCGRSGRLALRLRVR